MTEKVFSSTHPVHLDFFKTRRIDSEQVKVITFQKPFLFAAFRGFPQFVHTMNSPIFANSLKIENHLCQ